MIGTKQQKEFAAMWLITIFLNMLTCSTIMILYINKLDAEVQEILVNQNEAIAGLQKIVIDRNWLQWQAMNIKQMGMWYEENKKEINIDAGKKESLIRIPSINWKGIDQILEDKEKRYRSPIKPLSRRTDGKH